jgi:hypothetical protein
VPPGNAIAMKEQHKNPTPTVDIIIEKDSRILLIKRKNSELVLESRGRVCMIKLIVIVLSIINKILAVGLRRYNESDRPSGV